MNCNLVEGAEYLPLRITDIVGWVAIFPPCQGDLGVEDYRMKLTRIKKAGPFLTLLWLLGNSFWFIS